MRMTINCHSFQNSIHTKKQTKKKQKQEKQQQQKSSKKKKEKYGGRENSIPLNITRITYPQYSSDSLKSLTLSNKYLTIDNIGNNLNDFFHNQPYMEVLTLHNNKYISV